MDYQESPHLLFEKHKEELIPLVINGIHTCALQLNDSNGSYYAIPATDKRIQPFPSTIEGHFIRQIDYDTYHGKVAILKAYYL